MWSIYIGFQAIKLYCFLSLHLDHHRHITFPLFSSTTSATTICLLFSLHHHYHVISIVFPPRDSIKDYQLPFLVHFVAMSRVVNNNRGFLQLLADCPAYQRQFLLKTATPQQLHALVQVYSWDSFLSRRK